MDSLHPQSHHPSAAQGRAYGLCELREKLSAAVELLSELRHETGDYFLGAGFVDAAGAQPYFLNTG